LSLFLLSSSLFFLIYPHTPPFFHFFSCSFLSSSDEVILQPVLPFPFLLDLNVLFFFVNLYPELSAQILLSLSEVQVHLIIFCLNDGQTTKHIPARTHKTATNKTKIHVQLNITWGQCDRKEHYITVCRSIFVGVHT
jgi:hypothetical protein